MDKFEALKECKISYEYLWDLLENYGLLGKDEDTRQKLAVCTDKLSELYLKSWNLINENNNTKEILDTNIKCPYCQGKLIINSYVGYDYICLDCDESCNVGDCETEKYSWWKDDNKIDENMVIKNKINKIKGLGFGYDGCHKIYILETEEDIKEAKETGYDKVYDMSELLEIYNNSCPLRFINNWKLDKTFIEQFVIFD